MVMMGCGKDDVVDMIFRCFGGLRWVGDVRVMCARPIVSGLGLGRVSFGVSVFLYRSGLWAFWRFWCLEGGCCL